MNNIHVEQSQTTLAIISIMIIAFQLLRIQHRSPQLSKQEDTKTKREGEGRQEAEDEA